MSVELPKPEDVGAFYDRFTKLFELLWGDSLHFGYWPNGSTRGSIEEGQDRLTDLMMSKLDPGKGQRILDVGCGTGRATLRLADKCGCLVTAINISQQQIKAASRRGEKSYVSDRVRFDLADAMALPFAKESFDGAWAFESLLHMPILEKALSEIHRVLEPASRVVISDVVVRRPMSREDDAYYRQVFPVAPMPERDGYLATLGAAGFSVQEAIDITDDVARTLTLTLENIDKLRAEIEELYGAEIAGALKDSWSKCIGIHLASLGYFIFVARKE